MMNYEELSEENKFNNPHWINQSEDVPGFPHFFDFARLVGGSSLIGANLLA